MQSDAWQSATLASRGGSQQEWHDPRPGYPGAEASGAAVAAPSAPPAASPSGASSRRYPRRVGEPAVRALRGAAAATTAGVDEPLRAAATPVRPAAPSAPPGRQRGASAAAAQL